MRQHKHSLLSFTGEIKAHTLTRCTQTCCLNTYIKCPSHNRVPRHKTRVCVAKPSEQFKACQKSLKRHTSSTAFPNKPRLGMTVGAKAFSSNSFSKLGHSYIRQHSHSGKGFLLSLRLSFFFF